MTRSRNYETQGLETLLRGKEDFSWLFKTHGIDAEGFKLVVLLGEDIQDPEEILGYREIKIQMNPELLYRKSYTYKKAGRR